MPYKSEIPDHLPRILENIPKEVLPEPEHMDQVWQALALELCQLIRYGSMAAESEIVLTPFEQCGSQYIAFFSVSDLAITREEKYNWHGQNTSQWLYAGAIVIEDGRVSRHH